MNIGDRVSYFPEGIGNIHPTAEVVRITKTGRCRIRWTDALGTHEKTVTPRFLVSGHVELFEAEDR